MYMIEITDGKLNKMSEYVEDMLWAGGELMYCLEKMKGEHGGYGHRDYESRYGDVSERTMRKNGRMNYRDHEDWADDDDDMNERRRRRANGRYY